MELSEAEWWILKEAIENAHWELGELMRAKEWFVSDSIDLLESALEIIDEKEE